MPPRGLKRREGGRFPEVVRWCLSKRLAPFGFGDHFTVPFALAAQRRKEINAITGVK